MSKSPIRKDKTCLNCNYVVEKNFCPNCGQENIETRKTFHHLFVHFFEDLTHYENAFWKTIKNLIFKPAALTKEYLSGKRMSYLAPVRLYIFISFATFLIIAILPESDSEVIKFKETTTIEDVDSVDVNRTDTIVKREGTFFGEEFYGSVKELDSMQKFGKPEDKLSDNEYWFFKRVTQVVENNTPEELKAKFLDSFQRNLPKVLFIYMPIFAFILWIFQSKKKWYYFDHGIFTLHYFSFLLLSILTIFLLESFLSLFGDNIFTNFLSGIINFIGFLWMVYYFFPAHHRFYGETRLMSVFKGLIMLFINCLLIILLFIVYVCYTLINIH